MVTTITALWLTGGLVNLYLINNYNLDKRVSFLAFPFGIVGIFLAIVIASEKLLEFVDDPRFSNFQKASLIMGLMTIVLTLLYFVKNQ